MCAADYSTLSRCANVELASTRIYPSKTIPIPDRSTSHWRLSKRCRLWQGSTISISAHVSRRSQEHDYLINTRLRFVQSYSCGPIISYPVCVHVLTRNRIRHLFLRSWHDDRTLQVYVSLPLQERLFTYTCITMDSNTSHFLRESASRFEHATVNIMILHPSNDNHCIESQN